MNDMKRRVLFSFSVIGVVLLPLRALGEASPPSASTPHALGVTPSFQAKLSQLHDPEAVRQLLNPPIETLADVVRYPVSQQTVQGLRADLVRLYGAHQLTVVEHPVVGAGLQMDVVTARAFQGLGLQNGDLLLKANGLSLVNTDQIPTLVDSLSRARIINLLAVRGDDVIAIYFAVQ
jgi:hypothetical protein